MKTQVNLYTDEFHPKLRLLSLPIVLVLWSILLIAFVGIYGYVSTKQQNLRTHLGQLNKNNANQETLLNSLISQMNNVTAEQKLLDEVTTKQQQVSLKKRVYSELAGQEQIKSTGFADLMQDLAEYHHVDIWLKRIYLNHHHVTIEGGTSQSISIPKWLQKLGQGNFFKGQEFTTTRIYRYQDEQLNFVLSTTESSMLPRASNDEQ